MPSSLPPLRPGPVTADAINRRIGERVREIYGDNQIIECRRSGDVVNVILRVENLLPLIPKGDGFDVVPVNLTCDNPGADGTTNTTCAYIYSATNSIHTNVSYGSGIAYGGNRFIGKTKSATRGFMTISGTNRKLWLCDEVPNFAQHTDVIDVTCSGGTVSVTKDTFLSNY